MPDITKILIANRGEIACRVIRTARRMGIATVAVYSDADRDALHVRMADEAVHIGPAPAAESYLVIDKIVQAAKDTGADAVHPGYGFLSENPDFVRALDGAGIVFIGPSAEAIEAMGLKDRAKDLMEKAGVPITPGYQGEDQDDAVLAKAADATGYPVLIKAVAGGGGKGMRKVESADAFAEALASARREAQAAFGNDRVLIEKFVTSPRHIEVQVFGDTHGHVVHMFERDCSLQRRHQKVIEEAPAPGMTEEVRAAMTRAAVKAAQAVDYVGAGTVEFIVDGSGPLRTDGFYFMEMNTRLQVEHPVTEEITGLDLVEWQIRVARGERLPDQDEIRIDGHAVEARLYAEDPDADFLPSAGRLERLALDGGRRPRDARLRIDSGVEAGSPISVYYDPMIAKIITHGPDRGSAVDAMVRTLRRAEVTGLRSNLGFLARLADLEAFREGDVDTGLIARAMDGLATPEPDLDALALAAVAVARGGLPGRKAPPWTTTPRSPWDRRSAFRLNGPDRTSVSLSRDGAALGVTVELGEETDIATVDGRTRRVHHGRMPRDGDLRADDWRANVGEDRVRLYGSDAAITVPRYRPGGSDAAASPNALVAPMPGTVISVSAAPGDSVVEGQTLLVLEAMKMEMAIKAPRDGIVAEVAAEAGARVSDGDVLVSLEDG